MSVLEMNKIIILLISLSIIYGGETSQTEDIMISSGIMFVYFIISGETINCLQPHYNGRYQNKAKVCQWSEDKFYYRDGEYILYREDSSDNWIEKKMRKRYWKRRDG